tara:strand:+ start:274 stop:858 length:585 start_codon:yes stop_codon:yes gene_type:complete
MKKILLILFLIPTLTFSQSDIKTEKMKSKNHNLKKEINNLENLDLVELYSDILKVLKERGVIRTKNLVGDIGEYLAIKHYNSSKGKSNLQFAPPGTKNIDAISRNGDRYSIKSTTTNLTGVFYELENPESIKQNTQKFEYLLIVKFKENFVVDKIIQLDWFQFLKFKKWHSTMNAWNIYISEELLKDSEIIYEN